jgi:aminoglycoside phosphotransferase (APT) family kinase protein
MTEPDQQPLSAGAAAEIVADQCPELRPVQAVLLGEGCDSVAFEINGDWVFRFPKRADVEAQLVAEFRVLPRLASSAPVPIPVYTFEGQSAAGYPFRFGGYRKLTGVPALRAGAPAAAIGRDVGRFFSWLHSIRATALADLGVPTQDLGSLIDEVQADALADFPVVGIVAPGAPLDEWFAFVKARRGASAASGETVLLHNDFAAEHVLVGEPPAAVTGVIDWSDLALGDRSIDFAGVVHWGGRSFLEAVASHYNGSLDEPMVARATYLAACRGVLDVAFGVERERPEYVAAGLSALALAAGDARGRR